MLSSITYLYILKKIDNMKFKILILGAIYLLIFSLGCVHQPEETTTITSMTNSVIVTTTVSIVVDVSECEEIEKEEKRDDYYFKIAMNSNDTSSCDRINTSSLRDMCLFMVARDTADSIVCDKIEAPILDWCYLSVALNAPEYKTCDLIKNSSWRDLCYYCLAEFTNNTKLCNKIETEDWKGGCYHNFTASDIFCENIKGEEPSSYSLK